MPPASDGDRDRAARRRAVIRRHHPDVGGTAEELVTALAALDRPGITVVPTIRGRVRRIARQALRRRRRRTSPNLH